MPSGREEGKRAPLSANLTVFLEEEASAVSLHVKVELNFSGHLRKFEVLK